MPTTISPQPSTKRGVRDTAFIFGTLVGATPSTIVGEAARRALSDCPDGGVDEGVAPEPLPGAGVAVAPPMTGSTAVPLAVIAGGLAGDAGDEAGAGAVAIGAVTPD